MYAGSAHIETLRTASSLKSVQSIMHRLLGNDSLNVIKSMLEREK